MSYRFIYRCLKAKFKDQKYEIKSLIKHLSKADIFIDVGANKGSYILSMSKAVSKGMIYAFEPQPILSEYLKKEVNENNLKNVIIEELALSNKVGDSNLYVPGLQTTSPSATLESKLNPESTKNYRVKVSTIDDYFTKSTRNIGAIKIDVEGHERLVLEGAQETIKKHRPMIVCEMENRHLCNDSIDDMLEYFKKMKYSCYFVHHRKGIIPAKLFNKHIHQNEEGKEFWNKKDYCNNFIMKNIDSLFF